MHSAVIQQHVCLLTLEVSMFVLFLTVLLRTAQAVATKDLPSLLFSLVVTGES